MVGGGNEQRQQQLTSTERWRGTAVCAVNVTDLNNLTLWGMYYYYLHYTNKESEAEKDWATCPMFSS